MRRPFLGDDGYPQAFDETTVFPEMLYDREIDLIIELLKKIPEVPNSGKNKIEDGK